MRIAVIGTGRMGSALAAAWTSAGYDVILASRDPKKADRIASAILSAEGYTGTMGEQLPGLGSDTSGMKLVGGSVKSAVTVADVIVLATPFKGTADVLESIREHVTGQGKIFVDVTNPYLLGGSPGSADAEPAAVLHRDLLGDETASWAVGYNNIIVSLLLLSVCPQLTLSLLLQVQ
jgi:predicted dinucleotide-binding enzyme